MCNSWKREKCNHHFPELNGKRKLLCFVAIIFNLRTIMVGLFVFAVTGGLFYLTQTNISATRGYEMEALDEKMEALKEENKKLNLQYIELQSMANIVEQVKDMNLVATAEVDTISSLGSAVALR
jgi:hypothetical protein